MPIKVMSGIADATHTEARSPALKEGMSILIGTQIASTSVQRNRQKLSTPSR